ncbi:MAG TPA: hypothetical protein VMF06_08920 [Candidatus Limnocylindria bacterium]|nr:hypothetical protein [Candidatus Limnocylindria bacterium]
MPTEHPSRRLNLLLRMALLCLALLWITGCTSPMALEAAKGKLAADHKPIGIFKLRTENVYKPDYLPQVFQVIVISDSTKKSTTFKPSWPYKTVRGSYLEYLISIEAEPGTYHIESIAGQGVGNFFVGTFSFPINATFELTNGITYLGQIKMVNRERKEGEPHSGGVLPIIDQAVTGYFNSTFDVTLGDAWEADGVDFLQAYPFLKEVSISKSIMRK